MPCGACSRSSVLGFRQSDRAYTFGFVCQWIPYAFRYRPLAVDLRELNLRTMRIPKLGPQSWLLGKQRPPRDTEEADLCRIVAQLICGLVFFVFLSVVCWRGKSEILANKPVTMCVCAIAFSTTMMNLRGFYRSVELIQGWIGYLISHEGYVSCRNVSLVHKLTAN